MFMNHINFILYNFRLRVHFHNQCIKSYYFQVPKVSRNIFVQVLILAIDYVLSKIFYRSFHIFGSGHFYLLFFEMDSHFGTE